MPQTLIDNESVSLRFHPAERIVHHQIRQFVKGETFQQMLSSGADLMERHGGGKWLSDDRGHQVLSPEDEAWARSVWFPRVRAAGWKYWAIVKPEHVIGKMNLDRFAHDYGQMGITVRFFSDPDEALEWLKSQA
jgi:hypothetical protein